VDTPEPRVAASAVNITADGAADRAEPEKKRRIPELVSVSAGGVILVANDPKEQSHSKGGLVLTVNYRPAKALELEARYQGTFGGWGYLMRAADGGATIVKQDERIHRADLGTRYDVLRTLDLPIRLEPYAGIAYQGINSAVFSSHLFGGAGALRFSYDPDPRLALDMSGGIAGGFDMSADKNTVLGRVLAIWNWSAGVAMGPSEHTRVKLMYLGELMTRAHSNRLSNGALIAFELSFGKGPEAPKPATASATAKSAN
jgi:hypothetical protein